MKVLLTGSRGLIGSALTERLTRSGHAVTRLVRREPEADGEVRWDISSGTIGAAGLEGHDAAVHLAGASIARRGTPRAKGLIRDSRVEGTRLLCGTLAGLARPPRVLACASGVAACWAAAVATD